MKGYKLMETDMTCRGFQYEIGQIYEITEPIVICKRGFHFCENPFDCLGYYDNIEGDKRLFLIEALGEVITEGNKSLTNKIKILEEITDIEKFFDENINNFEVDYYVLSINQQLSEKFIEKYIDNFNWYYILKYQTLSKKFIRKHNIISWLKKLLRKVTKK